MTNSTSRAVMNIVHDTVMRDEVPASVGAVAPIAKAIQPIIDHATNSEPWFRSRVIIGNIIAVILALMALVGLLANGVTEYEALAAPIGIILANGFSLYGRLVATRPLGT